MIFCLKLCSPLYLRPKKSLLVGFAMVLAGLCGCSNNFVSLAEVTEIRNANAKNDEDTSCEAPGSSFAGIVGGEALASGNILSASTVMVRVQDIGGSLRTCTGTLIDTDKVLTAAHCARGSRGQALIAFTNNKDCAERAPLRTLRRVGSQTVHPDFRKLSQSLDTSGYDLAIMKFIGGLPNGFAPMPLPDASLTVPPNATLVLAGYGDTSEQALDAGLLRFTTAPSHRLSTEFFMNLLGVTLTIKNTLVLDQSSNGVCKGDSGGPLYVYADQKLSLLGITSKGVDNKTDGTGKALPCHGVALFTDIRPHLEWILKQLD